ncbi:translation initiation factor IF-2 [Rhodoblastus acidophilus]|uniref:Translation initiation factor IF-2 n=1 Tax=Rhodoblastus acidophilus TaxID=1074 RepID=A0A6N8DR73_RHOAC|nr:translation initiation factor IF-2 [Rhodoblastus acidophilus]MCW2275545.1 translation initiation factor IF-2 [Rhodoblastus acidophilus]MTV32045.1 translation initiation factor IF-2 [Rhodoblastus acidophilus]
MNDTNNSGEKPASKTLSLKRPPEQGTVRQSFSHGRTKTVVVEHVKRRQHNEAPKAPAPAAPAPSVAPTPAPVAAAPAPAPAPAARGPQKPAAPRPQTGVVLRTLTDDERDARARALTDARQREEEDRRRQEADAKARAERETREKAEREAAEARKREEETRLAREAEAKRRAEDEARRRLQPGAAPQPQPEKEPSVTFAPTKGSRPQQIVFNTPKPAAPAPAAATPAAQPAAASAAPAQTTAAAPAALTPRIRPMSAPKLAVPAPKPTRGAEKQRGRLTVTSATASADGDERTRSVAAFRRRTQRMKGVVEQKERLSREVVLPETITIQELANRMSERGVDVIKLLMRQGQMHKITDVIDADTAELIATELGHSVKRVAESDVEEGLFDTPDAEETLESRPPVVTIMGHVDHGKTSLLDAIRQANVVSGEAGGITQHIGAYQVTSPLGGKVTFIDTPGHAAFTAMRARGAKVTDIVVLVVAADDGVMPQTVEAISHAKAAGVPLIVAINKIDKPDAKPERVRTELLQYEVQVESLGGDTLEVEVSAKQKLNLDRLLEAITLQAEVLDLKANPERPAEGTVIEARLDRGRGPVATVLVQRGTLAVGNIIVAGSQWGRVRALIDDQGANCVHAGPSFPAEVLGFNGAPEAGDRVAVVESEARAREITEYRDRQKREQAAVRGTGARSSLVDMMSQLKATAGRKEVPLVIKGDVQGSVEAIAAALEKLGTDEVAARLLHAGVGGITESDITLAEASNAVVIGFNVRAHKEAREASERLGIEIRYYNIIYNLVDDIKAAMSGLLAPTLRETMLGNASILEVFTITKVGKVAGCRVTDGTMERGQHVRLIRDNVVVHEGKLSTLKRFKDEVSVVQPGQECGMAFENYQDMRPGDVIECYRVEEIKRTL